MLGAMTPMELDSWLLVTATGMFPDTCTIPTDTTTRQEGDAFFVEVYKYRPANKPCEKIATPWSTSIYLNIKGITTGTVDVNGVTERFWNEPL